MTDATVGQTSTGTPLAPSVNPKTQPGSSTIPTSIVGDSGVPATSDHYPKVESKNDTDRGSPTAMTQDARGYGHGADKGSAPAVKNTSAGRIRSIPNP